MANNVPVKMRARSAQPIDHWYWGRVVHDMAGMKLHKSSIPMDYEHAEPIGYLDSFKASNDGLDVAGAMVLTGEPGDPAARLAALRSGGVPYEASINFAGDMRIEIIAEGQVASVNGYWFEGPGIVIREWQLRGVAVCPYGADMRTESQFSFSQGGQNVSADSRFVSGNFPPRGTVTTFADERRAGRLPKGVTEWTEADRAKRAAELAVGSPAPVADKPRKGIRFAQGVCRIGLK